MRISLITGAFLLLSTSVAAAEPTTVECLGSLDNLLSCPEGTELIDHGSAAYCATPRGFDAWPPAARNGPSVWYHYRKPTVIQRAGHYKNHKKHGRHYRFDDNGRLEAIVDWKDDNYHGRMIDCYDNGNLQSVMTWVDGKLDGLSIHFDESGKIWWASRYSNGKYMGRLENPKGLKVPSSDVCRPKRCDLDALGD